ncbi:MAG: hypothetical protein ACI9XB_003981 [Gammaproteobacteria bacterium]|jgi:hypothetical protein
MATGDPYSKGEVVVPPPHKTMPPETGFTPFWEKHRGLLYVPDNETQGLDLSIGAFVRFHLRQEISPSGANINVSYDISNF